MAEPTYFEIISAERLCDAILDTVYETMLELFPAGSDTTQWPALHTLLCAFNNWEVIYGEMA